LRNIRNRLGKKNWSMVIRGEQGGKGDPIFKNKKNHKDEEKMTQGHR